MAQSNPKSRRSIERGSTPPPKSKTYSLKVVYSVLKQLQANAFNLTMTAKQTGVSTVTLKKWRDKYPEAFKNEYHDTHLKAVEAVMATENKLVVAKASQIAMAALTRAGDLVGSEKNLDKISGLIKAITPMIKALGGESNESTDKRIGAIQSTLGKLAQMNNLDIEDVEIEEPE